MNREDRLIKAMPLYEKLEERYKYSKGEAHKAYGLAIDDVVDAETEDAALIIHSHWVEKPTGFYCGHCTKQALQANSPKVGAVLSDYCPYCGAKMDEKI